MYITAPHAYLVLPKEGIKIPWNWSYRRFWASMGVLRIELESFGEQPVLLTAELPLQLLAAFQVKWLHPGSLCGHPESGYGCCCCFLIFKHGFSVTPFYNLKLSYFHAIRILSDCKFRAGPFSAHLSSDPSWELPFLPLSVIFSGNAN